MVSCQHQPHASILVVLASDKYKTRSISDCNVLSYIQARQVAGQLVTAWSGWLCDASSCPYMSFQPAHMQLQLRCACSKIAQLFPFVITPICFCFPFPICHWSGAVCCPSRSALLLILFSLLVTSFNRLLINIISTASPSSNVTSTTNNIALIAAGVTVNPTVDGGFCSVRRKGYQQAVQIGLKEKSSS